MKNLKFLHDMHYISKIHFKKQEKK